MARGIKAGDPGELVEAAALLGIGAVDSARRLPHALPCAGSVTARGRHGAMRGALVVDLSALWAGPLCGHVLTSAPARVVKVESASRLDGARRRPPAFYDVLHAGQESVVLDLPAKADHLRAVVRAADVVIDASRPRAMTQLGIDVDEIAEGGQCGCRSPATAATVRVRARRLRRRCRGGRGLVAADDGRCSSPMRSLIRWPAWWPPSPSTASPPEVDGSSTSRWRGRHGARPRRRPSSSGRCSRLARARRAAEAAAPAGDTARFSARSARERRAVPAPRSTARSSTCAAPTAASPTSRSVPSADVTVDADGGALLPGCTITTSTCSPSPQHGPRSTSPRHPRPVSTRRYGRRSIAGRIVAARRRLPRRSTDARPAPPRCAGTRPRPRAAPAPRGRCGCSAPRPAAARPRRRFDRAALRARRPHRDRIEPQPVDLTAAGHELAAHGVTGVTDLTPTEDPGFVDALAEQALAAEFPLRVTITGSAGLAGVCRARASADRRRSSSAITTCRRSTTSSPPTGRRERAVATWPCTAHRGSHSSWRWPHGRPLARVPATGSSTAR